MWYGVGSGSVWRLRDEEEAAADVSAGESSEGKDERMWSIPSVGGGAKADLNFQKLIQGGSGRAKGRQKRERGRMRGRVSEI